MNTYAMDTYARTIRTERAPTELETLSLARRRTRATLREIDRAVGALARVGVATDTLIVATAPRARVLEAAIDANLARRAEHLDVRLETRLARIEARAAEMRENALARRAADRLRA